MEGRELIDDVALRPVVQYVGWALDHDVVRVPVAPHVVALAVAPDEDLHPPEPAIDVDPVAPRPSLGGHAAIRPRVERSVDVEDIVAAVALQVSATVAQAMHADDVGTDTAGDVRPAAAINEQIAPTPSEQVVVAGPAEDAVRALLSQQAGNPTVNAPAAVQDE
jgi:hypothetical protein